MAWYLFVLTYYFVSKVSSLPKPNIFFILADDLGWAEVGYHRNPPDNEVSTPNIDKLATTEGLQLNRHYTYYICMPTRSSFQSGRLPVHVNTNDLTPKHTQSGVPQNMTVIATRMKEAGYSTHIVGKWHVGMATYTHTPLGRGYDTSLIYFNAEIDYYRHTNNGCNQNDKPNIDLWLNNAPAYIYNNSQKYVELIFAEHVYDLIDSFNTSNDPFFMVYTPHLTHTPLQIPEEYYIYDFDDDENGCGQKTSEIWPGFNDTSKFKCRTTYHAMVTLLDDIVGNITNKLKANNLWDNTLIVFVSDNGGELTIDCCGSNNAPLRGGKHFVFEGGVRTASFVSGGYLPVDRRNKIENGFIHIADWYSTFILGINGMDPTDTNAAKHNLPPIDSLNMWPLITGINTTSPRVEYPINFQSLIQGNYKYITTNNVPGAAWQGTTYPNSSSPQHQVTNVDMNCVNSHGGCLFDVVNDITEHHDISKQYPNITKRLSDRLKELTKTFYNNSDILHPSCNYSVVSEKNCPCYIVREYWDGWFGPYCFDQ